jgi:hypothetical protein
MTPLMSAAVVFTINSQQSSQRTAIIGHSIVVFLSAFVRRNASELDGLDGIRRRRFLGISIAER